MAVMNLSINFNGNAQEAFTFYQSVFGGSFTKIILFKDIASPENPIPDKEADKIMHIALPVGQNLLIGNDVPEIMGRVNEMENRSKIAITAASREEANQLFNGLSAGGTVEFNDDNPEGAFFAMFRDKYGIEWMIEFEAK